MMSYANIYAYLEYLYFEGFIKEIFTIFCADNISNITFNCLAICITHWRNWFWISLYVDDRNSPLIPILRQKMVLSAV
jgi:hypothetical protein